MSLYVFTGSIQPFMTHVNRTLSARIAISPMPNFLMFIIKNAAKKMPIMMMILKMMWNLEGMNFIPTIIDTITSNRVTILVPILLLLSIVVLASFV